MVYRLLDEEGIYVGASSALNVVAAVKVAEKLGKGSSLRNAVMLWCVRPSDEECSVLCFTSQATRSSPSSATELTGSSFSPYTDSS